MHHNGGHDRGPHHRFHHRFAGSSFFYDDDYPYYAYSDCWILRRYHTNTGWHRRRVYVCN